MNSRDKVLRSVFDLMISRGDDGLSVNDMLRELNMTKGGFYYYFKSRDQLMCEIVRGCMMDMIIRPLEDAVKTDDGSLPVRDTLRMYYCLLPKKEDESAERCNVRNYFFLLFEMLEKYPELRNLYREYYMKHMMALRDTVDREIRQNGVIKCADAYGCAEMMMSARSGILALNIIYGDTDLKIRLERSFDTIWNEITCRGGINE